MRKSTLIVVLLLLFFRFLVYDVKAGSLVPEPNTVWVSGDGVTASYSPVKGTICWGYFIQGYGNNMVVKFWEAPASPIQFTSAGCEITDSVTVAQRAAWAAAKYGLTFNYSEMGISPTPTLTLTPSETFTPSNTPTETPTFTRTNTPTETATVTSSATSTSTSTSTNTITPTPTAISTSSSTPTSTSTETSTSTPTSTSTNTATNTATSTNTSTSTPTSTNTPTVTSTSTLTPSETATATSTNTATYTVTSTASRTATATSTSTSSRTSTKTVTNTPTITLTPSLVVTVIPRLSFTWSTGIGIYDSWTPRSGDLCWGNQIGSLTYVIVEYTSNLSTTAMSTAYCQRPAVNSAMDIRNFFYNQGQSYTIMRVPNWSPTRTRTSTRTATPSRTRSPTRTLTPLPPIRVDMRIVGTVKYRPKKGDICWGKVVDGRSWVLARVWFDYLNPIEITDGGCQFAISQNWDVVLQYIRRYENPNYTWTLLP